jgi:spore germination cell wall hydrolase CwlJ-like protein
VLVDLLPLPQDTEPGTWPQILLYAATVFLEAEGEPDPGQLAVAWVIRNRMDQQKAAARVVILGPDEAVAGDQRPFEAFSCWNDDYVGRARQRLVRPNPDTWEACWRAASAAYWRLTPDPTRGAVFYLNVDLTRQVRPDHKLPSWYDPKRVRLRVGRQEFLI